MMSGDKLWSTVATVAILIAAGLVVMTTSIAALNAASLSANGGVSCSHHHCISLASSY